MISGAFRERVREAWTEIRENLGRSVLQSLGVILGVASVLGGFSISDSQRRQSDRLFVKMGGLDKLNVQPNANLKSGKITALQTANLGLRHVDASEGEELDTKDVAATSVRRMARARMRSEHADQERQVTGIAADFIPLEGYAVAKGRAFTATDLETGAPLAILGSEAADTFFPGGDAVGQVITLGTEPVTVVGVFQERVFRFRDKGGNVFRWRNRIVATPSTFVQRRLQGDSYGRVDRVTFRLPKLDAMKAFSRDLASLLKANHRQQEDFRLDDVASRIAKRRSQGEVYDIIFLLSGVLALLGGGIININIQMASLKERVREVGVKMAIGASGLEVFKGFMTEAMLLTGLGGTLGLTVGIAFSWIMSISLGVPLYMNPMSFLWSVVLAAVFGFAFALYPAWKASRLSPMEALRYE